MVLRYNLDHKFRDLLCSSNILPLLLNATFIDCYETAFVEIGERDWSAVFIANYPNLCILPSSTQPQWFFSGSENLGSAHLLIAF